ncbi:MAG: tyrosine-type recombinase/integrase [Steroidobacteraceae bacterium]|jgi:site-specific recombinase XerD
MNNTAASEALQQEVRPPGVDASQCLKDFDDHLTRVQGLAPRTRQSYCFWVSRFLARFCALDAPDWSSLRAEHVTTFVQREASRLHRYSRAIPGTAIRAFLRYLTFVGFIRSGLEAAVPRMPRWKHAELPRYLPPADVERVVGGVLDGTPKGLRNHAILLLLARTGLRADEVSKLSLGDIDWVAGTICIPSTKSHRERRLPLAQDVGAALCSYLKNGRPPCRSRTIFLRSLRPFDPFLNSAAICKIARRAMTRVGILNTPAAAHLFRHSAATGMLRGGATFKEIADVLGHASLKTTGIYAKLDLAALSRVALPWPESAQ